LSLAITPRDLEALVKAVKLGEEVADKVLADALCSSSGTLMKNPELRWRIMPEKIQELQDLQLQLLDVAVRLV